YYCARSDYAFA
nr:immunoglobulin heavy chain junction region [Mus musculus]